MIIPRGTIVPLALLTAILTVTVTFNAGIAGAPQAFFGEAGTVIIGPAGGASPGTGTVPAQLVGPLRALPYVATVSPEIFALTTLEGKSLLVRGVDVSSFLRIERGAITGGRGDLAQHEAMAGDGALAAFHLKLGDRVLLPSSSARIVVPVRIVGSFHASGPANDEILVTLDDARGLTKVDGTNVHLIRVDTASRGELSELVSSVGPKFTYSDVKLSALDVLANEPLMMTANLTNWGLTPGAKTVQVKEDGVVVQERNYQVGARQTVPVELGFVLSHPGSSNVTINPTFRVLVHPPDYHFVDLPTAGVSGSPLSFRLLTSDGANAPGVVVTLDDSSNVTDEGGFTQLVPMKEGKTKILAYKNGIVNAVARLYVSLPENANASFAMVDGLEPPIGALGVNAASVFTVKLHNRGGATGPVRVGLTVDGNVNANATSGPLAPGESGVVTIALPPQAPGLHIIGTDPPGPRLTTKTYPGRDPEVEALLDALQAVSDGAAAVGTPQDSQSYVDKLVGHVGIAVLTLSVTSGVLVALGGVAVLSRHIGERAPSIGALKAIGASDRYLIAQAAREAAITGSIAGALGIGGGLALGAIIDRLGIVRAFGHAVHPGLAWNQLALLWFSTIVFVLGASRLVITGALANSARSLLSGEVVRRDQAEAPQLRRILENVR